MMKFPG
jgi:hypothetical protein